MTAFAALEARVNAAALSRLANAEGVLAGVAVKGIFDADYVVTEGGTGMESTMPAFTLPTAAVPASPRGRTFVCNDIIYAVIEHQPDGTGKSVLLLERAT